MTLKLQALLGSRTSQERREGVGGGMGGMVKRGMTEGSRCSIVSWRVAGVGFEVM